MSSLIVLALALLLSLSALPAHAADVACADLVEGMRDLHWRVRQGHVLDNEQQALWRTWNQACASPAWQTRLIREEVAPRAPLPRPAPAPSLTWRDYAGAILLGLAEGAARPSVYCRTDRRGDRLVSYCY